MISLTARRANRRAALCRSSVFSRSAVWAIGAVGLSATGGTGAGAATGSKGGGATGAGATGAGAGGEGRAGGGGASAATGTVVSTRGVGKGDERPIGKGGADERDVGAAASNGRAGADDPIGPACDITGVIGSGAREGGRAGSGG